MKKLIYKSRVEPTQLSILRALNARMELTKAEQRNLLNLKKGYEGEIQFDSWLQQLSCDCLVLNDLLLKSNNNLFQIDSLVIFNHAIYIFEIKNFSGEFYFQGDRLFQRGGHEINNPLLQVQRTESLLRQLLLKLEISIPVRAFTVFINPEFTLFQAPLDKAFLLFSQLNRYFKNLESEGSKLKELHQKLAEKLVNLQIHSNPYSQLPSYEYHQLQKGINCSACNSLSGTTRGFYYVCMDCQTKERFESAIIKNTLEFKLLFPNEKLTTSKIYDWCNFHISHKTIQRILERNFQKLEVRRWTYYE